MLTVSEFHFKSNQVAEEKLCMSSQILHLTCHKADRSLHKVEQSSNYE
jgi:hypothetical protein